MKTYDITLTVTVKTVKRNSRMQIVGELISEELESTIKRVKLKSGEVVNVTWNNWKYTKEP